MAEPPTLGVVIVSWKVPQLLDRCLASLAACGLPLRTVVVDNASGDATAAMVRERHPGVLLIVNDGNRGFTAANNQGLRALGLRLGGADGVCGIHESHESYGTNGTHATDRTDTSTATPPTSPPDAPPAFVLLLNPDTEVDPAAPARLLACLAAHPRAGVAGPGLFYGDGRPQPSRRRFPTLLTAWVESTPIGWHLPGLRAIARFHMADRPEAGDERVDWLVGAALLCRREALEAAGGLDEGFFMYSEELDLCRRLADLGWETWYCPDARILHHEGQSSGQVSGLRHRIFMRSRIRYVAKHQGARAAAWLRRGILAQYAVELLLEAAKGLLGHKRELRRARVAAYAELLRDGLR